MEPRRLSYDSMGCIWNVSVWDSMSTIAFAEIQSSIIADSQAFDQLYSRFIPSSLINYLSTKTGTFEVPCDLVAMLRIYERLHELSEKKFTPLVGFSLSDMGYDEKYSLAAKPNIRKVPNLHDVLTILDDRHIALKEHVLIDVGAAGKGFFVDKISSFLRSKGIRRFLADGSGDIFYEGDGRPIRAGLEHPDDPAKVIGVFEFERGAFCASGGNRRRWDKYHHIIDPQSLSSPSGILATWTYTQKSTAMADALATCVFLCDTRRLEEALDFDYCILNNEYKVKRSAGFTAELF